ncbi:MULTISPECIES: GNAT family N-acetyltransferase [unclassified Clostridium]|uniref:GNAT family N-acetyltransferase n=1 Tax=unclassified Clostridium TaxID=2614128 RepID=UPI0032178AD8
MKIMKVVIYDKVKDFLNINEEILLEKESVNQLILFNAYVNREKDTDSDVLFGRVEDESGVSLVFCNVSPYNLQINNLKEKDDNAIKALVDYLIENKINIVGINANKKVCDKFIEYYEGKTKCQFKERLAMDIMELRKLNSVTLPKGYFREATEQDLDLVIDWHIKFGKEALNEDMVVETFIEKLVTRIRNGAIYIFEDENHVPVSMAAFTKQLKKGISVSLVYSDARKRGMGYGVAVVYNLSKLYLERGNEFCSLFVDKRNPVSNGVYTKIGYKIIEDNFDYRIVQ